MHTTFRDPITVSMSVNAGIDLVWKLWTTPEDIMRWNNTSEEWHTPRVENDLRPGGRFLFEMGLKDGSFQFNFEGQYDSVEPNKMIRYTLGDGRHSQILFTGSGPVLISETFVPENTESLERQTAFCRAVLDSFRRYTEARLDS